MNKEQITYFLKRAFSPYVTGEEREMACKWLVANVDKKELGKLIDKFFLKPLDTNEGEEDGKRR